MVHLVTVAKNGAEEILADIAEDKTNFLIASATKPAAISIRTATITLGK